MTLAEDDTVERSRELEVHRHTRLLAGHVQPGYLVQDGQGCCEEGGGQVGWSGVGKVCGGVCGWVVVCGLGGDGGEGCVCVDWLARVWGNSGGWVGWLALWDKQRKVA